MFSLSLDYQGFDALDEALGQLALRASDLRPLAEEMRGVMIADNADRSMQGVDLHGVALAPLAEYTLKTRKGTGPPLAPQGAAARLVSDFTVDIHHPTPDSATVVGHWPSSPHLKYHVTGYTNARTGTWVPARNPAGLTPLAEDKVIDAFGRFVVWVTQAFTGP